MARDTKALKKVLVIGSNSFSGSDFIDLVLEHSEYEVIGISRSPEKSALFLPYLRHDRKRFSFHQLDLNLHMRQIIDLLEQEQPDFVVNFAAQSEVAPSWKNPEQWFQTNAVAISILGNYLKSAPYLRKYVHISSPEVYGSCSGVVREDAKLNPSTPYAASKAAGDFFLFTLVKNFNFPMVMIRATNVYGAHQQLHKIIPRSVIYIKSGRTIELHGGGQAIKSYIHIRDVSRGELIAMEQGTNGNIYHLSPDQGISVKDLVARISKYLNVSFDQAAHSVDERLGQDASYIIDSSKARQELAWKTHVDIEVGLRGVISWAENNWDAIQKESLEYAHKP